MAAILIFTLTVSISICVVASEDVNFSFNGFRSGDLFLDGVANTSNGLLVLTNYDMDQEIGHAFYPNSISFKNKSNIVSSFSATFVFAITSNFTAPGHGIAFVVSPTRGIPGARPSQSLGLFNESTNGNETNHIFAVELDIIRNTELEDINNNHVGIDINGLVSKKQFGAGYYVDGEFRNLTLISGEPMQVWVEYDGFEKLITVTMAPINVTDKPKTPLLSLRQNLSSIFNDIMYVGFSSSTGSTLTWHYILGWSFRINGQAQRLDISKLPKLPLPPPPPIGTKQKSKLLTVGLPLICVSVALIVISGIVYFFYRRRKFAEILEDWEEEYGPIRFKYKDLYKATKGFKEKEVLGVGGFGRVYKGVLPNSKIEVAVKKISHESKQGMKEFVAEIVSVGHLRHRNVVGLLGYCRRNGELFLVYEYMSNGSLDKYLHDRLETTVNWEQRFEIIKGVASGLFYLHEQCEQVVIHRDVKASNVLLDEQFNARLGDFGLAKLYDRGVDPRTTNVVGTLGYLAPELMRTGRATTRSDVYAFGAFLLEVACGSRPIQQRGEGDDFILMDWVFSCWTSGNILRTADPKLHHNFEPSELELVLKLGLLCSHSSPAVRPTMHQVLQYLEADTPLPDLALLRWRLSGNGFLNLMRRCRDGNDVGNELDDISMSYPFLPGSNVSGSPSVAESILKEGR